MAQEYLPRDYDVFMGIDVDKKKFSFTVKDRNGTMSRSKTIPSQPQQLYNYVTNQFADQKVLFAYEALTHRLPSSRFPIGQEAGLFGCIAGIYSESPKSESEE